MLGTEDGGGTIANRQVAYGHPTRIEKNDFEVGSPRCRGVDLAWHACACGAVGCDHEMTCERGGEIAQVLLSNVIRKNAVGWQRESIAHGRARNGNGGIAGRPTLVREGGEIRQAEERERQPPATSTRPPHALTPRPHYRASMPPTIR